MTKDELRAIDDEGLCRHCVEPAVALVRGKPTDLSVRLYETLGTGQRPPRRVRPDPQLCSRLAAPVVGDR